MGATAFFVRRAGWSQLLLTLAVACLVGCSGVRTVPRAALTMPPQLADKATLVNTSDPDYGRAMLGNAVKEPGQGGIYDGLVIKTTRDLPVYRLWNGPSKRDSRGNTNRLGAWWSFVPPGGNVETYRLENEVCRIWNDLTWVASCTLKAGAVVAIGPGQSVSALTCLDETGVEKYPDNPEVWQMYIDKAWTRTSELACPGEAADYEAEPGDIGRRKK